jgi:hypothetical protein
MPRVYAAVDHVEPITDTMMEQFGNERDYHWDSGCELSYSATDLVVTIGAGNVTHNGSDVTVAEDTITLVPDATNPLWAHIAIDSTGNAVVVHGTAAADPVVPELGDYVELALVKVEAGQVYANACEHKIDKHLKGKSLVTLVTGTGATTATLTADAAATASFGVVAGLNVALGASSKYLFEGQFIIRATSAGDYYFDIDAPSGAVLIVYSIDGTDKRLESGYTLSSFAASEVRNVHAFGSVTTTTAGNLTVSHYGNGRVLKAGSRIELN